ncbi:hypothetical protein CHELA20_50365 [Hyphomicrobiales bacterium]|nr:hypothetical protein CHELA41_20010 [Hyphomicrobiales bacterium]CAH1668532.1 hypothetical protein CHELA20_50365 [Hyphomicrobiales bacterium]
MRPIDNEWFMEPVGGRFARCSDRDVLRHYFFLTLREARARSAVGIILFDHPVHAPSTTVG